MADTGSRINAIAQAGQFFSVTYNDDVSGSRTYHVLAFENLAINKKTMYLDSVLGGILITPTTTPRDDYQATFIVYVFEGINLTGGTELLPENLNLGSSIEPDIIVYANPEIKTTRYFSMTNNPSGEYFFNFDGKIIVPPGHILGITADTGLLDAQGFIMLTVTWYELGDEQGDGSNVII